MARRNAEIADARRIVFRIGINVGDIITEEGDIFGDGVNIAARLEALCEPGGLCISRTTNDQIRDKLSLPFADLGAQIEKYRARSWCLSSRGNHYCRAFGTGSVLRDSSGADDRKSITSFSCFPGQPICQGARIAPESRGAPLRQ